MDRPAEALKERQMRDVPNRAAPRERSYGQLEAEGGGKDGRLFDGQVAVPARTHASDLPARHANRSSEVGEAEAVLSPGKFKLTLDGEHGARRLRLREIDGPTVWWHALIVRAPAHRQRISRFAWSLGRRR